MLRHGLAAFLLLALVAPLVPAAGTPMVCCRGTGGSCSCPIQPGFARCPSEQTAAAITQMPPAILPSAPPALELAASPAALPGASERPVSQAPRPLVPPPRA